MSPLCHRRRFAQTACALSLSLLLVPAASGAAQPSARDQDVSSQLGLVPTPSEDPFYAVPPDIGRLPNGAILASRPVQATALAVAIPANAWQVKYKTIDQHGQPSAFVTTILVPRTPWPGPGPRPLLSYQAAIDALSTKCAPSYVLRAGLEAAQTGGPTVLASNPATETANILQAVDRGYAVAVPDWEGPEAEWISSAGAARGVLDGIRAVMDFAPAAISRSARVALVGYSGGALATDWAIQMQPAYAPKLRFVGAALGGTPASLQASIADFAANPGAMAAIPLLLAALERSYPQWNLGQYLSPAGRAAVADSQNDCLLDALIRNAGIEPTGYEAYPGAIFDNPHLDRLLAGISPLGYPGVPRTPILFYHSTDDELAPIAKMHQLAARYCAGGVPVHVVTSAVGEHISYVLAGFPTALSYIADRFAGLPAPNDCNAPPPTAGCPRATGKLSGRTLGLVRLGMSRAQAARAYPKSSTRGFKYMEFFCLTPRGVRVGFASPKLLETLPVRERQRFQGRVIWASTSNDLFGVRGVRPGVTVRAAHKHLRLAGPFRVGLNDWYFAPNGVATAVLKVRHGTIEEIGIGAKTLTDGRRRARLAFLTSFS
jgi:hypothetical protein